VIDLLVLLVLTAIAFADDTLCMLSDDQQQTKEEELDVYTRSEVITMIIKHKNSTFRKV
jgi:hypothetical protein